MNLYDDAFNPDPSLASSADEWSGDNPLERRLPALPGGDWLASLRQLWQWEDLAAEIGQESQARIALVGRTGAGKSLLFNRLRGWPVSTDREPAAAVPLTASQSLHVESLGFFLLADLPDQLPDDPHAGGALMMALGEPAMLVYLIDAARGVTAIDYRWVASLRASGKPLVVGLNKIDLLEEAAATLQQAERRLGMPLIPLSAQTGYNVEDRFLPALLDAAPKLAVPLGRELDTLRRIAARRVIRRTALMAGVMGAEPLPVLDLPFQIILQVGVVMRVGAAYGVSPTGGVNRELIGAVIGSLSLRYAAASLVKLVPLLGWVVSGVLSSTSTWLIGEAALRYYEAGGTISLKQALAQQRARWIPTVPLSDPEERGESAAVEETVNG